MAAVVTSYKRTNDLKDITLSTIDGGDTYNGTVTDVMGKRVYSNGSVPHNDRVHTISTMSDSSAGKGSGSKGASLVFQDVSVVIGKKLILNKVSGVAKVGQMLAIMGPSGAGKSTLLNVLGGRVPATSGNITLNNQTVNRHLRRKISYVMQQDVFYPNLTLRETLHFATMMRLPAELPYQLKLNRLQEIIDALELNKCLHTKMGGTFVTGLSGGEKKRASIACELLTNPRILVLDEPTSGLDSAIAFSLMSTLSKYASQSRKTVVTTIHQPSSQIFYMFTNVLLITEGEVAYFGSGHKILDFFSSISLHCEPHYNPADFILEQVKSDPETVKKIVAAAKLLRQSPEWPTELKEHSHNSSPVIITVKNYMENKESFFSEDENDDDLHSNDVMRKNKSNENDPKHPNGIMTYNNKSYTQSTQSAIRITSETDVESSHSAEDKQKWPTGFLLQYRMLTWRSFLRSKTRYLSKYNIGQMLFMAVCVGLVWFQTARTEETAKDRLGILFFVIVQNGFHPMMEATFSMKDETGVFMRDRASGIYRLSAYYIATMTTEIPTAFCVTTMYAIVVYWMTGLMKAAYNFIAFWLILVLNVYVAQSVGFFFGILIDDKGFAVIIAQCFMVLSLLAGGFYNTHVEVWFRWIRYVSIVTYALGAMSKIEFEHGDPFQCSNTTTFPSYCSTPAEQGQSVPGIALLKSWDLYVTPIYADILIMFAIIIAFRIAGYITLRIKRPSAQN